MARTSQTETAILGALSVEPMTGYALREGIRDVLGHFWSESFGQIYPTLAELERTGHVTRRGSSRPGSSTFAITRLGRARLKQRLTEPIQPVPPRSGLMLRLFFGRQLGPQACRFLALESRAEAERRLGQYKAIRHELGQDEEHAEDRPYWLFTVSAGEHAARAAMAWADETLSALDEIEACSGASKQRRRS
jgi:DNA-binding PadR family transcriptional regulator